MIPDDKLEALENQVRSILDDAGWTDPPVPDVGRMEVITYRACLESITREYTPRPFRDFNVESLQHAPQPEALPSFLPGGLTHEAPAIAHREECCCANCATPPSDEDRRDPDPSAGYSRA